MGQGGQCWGVSEEDRHEPNCRRHADVVQPHDDDVPRVQWRAGRADGPDGAQSRAAFSHAACAQLQRGGAERLQRSRGFGVRKVDVNFRRILGFMQLGKCF